MMRRKPYAQLPGVYLSTGGSQLRDSGQTSARAAPEVKASAAALSAEEALRYRAEIQNLAAMTARHRSSASGEGRKVCAFTDEKLAEASGALDKGDGEACWFHLFGAAKICVGFETESEQVKQAIGRINALL